MVGPPMGPITDQTPTRTRVQHLTHMQSYIARAFTMIALVDRLTFFYYSYDYTPMGQPNFLLYGHIPIDRSTF